MQEAQTFTVSLGNLVRLYLKIKKKIKAGDKSQGTMLA